jgi:SAM-dependent MidA family methyltransferase
MENMKNKRLRVLEMGPGTGTFADSLLDFYKNYNLDIYRECEYVFVEISP